MKEIISQAYKSMVKKAYGWDLPGDSSLPPGVTQKDIDRGFGGEAEGPDEDVSTGLRGESEITIDWKDFNEWYLTGGSEAPSPFGGRTQPSDIHIDFTYDRNNGVNVENLRVYNIQPIGGIDFLTNSPISDMVFLESIVEYNEEEIKNDILEAEREMGSNRSSYDY